MDVIITSDLAPNRALIPAAVSRRPKRGAAKSPSRRCVAIADPCRVRQNENAPDGRGCRPKNASEARVAVVGHYAATSRVWLAASDPDYSPETYIVSGSIENSSIRQQP